MRLAIIVIARLLIPGCWKSLYLKQKQTNKPPPPKNPENIMGVLKREAKVPDEKSFRGGNIWVDLWRMKIEKEKEGINILKVLTNLSVNWRGERKRKLSEGNKYVDYIQT